LPRSGSATIDDDGEVPNRSSGQSLWYHIRSDGSKITVWAATTEGGLGTENDICFEQPNWDNGAPNGGHIGLRGPGSGTVNVGKVTVKLDLDDDDTYGEAGEVQLVEEFEVDSGGGDPSTDHAENWTASETVHDAAGNLLYDGKWYFTYDAWNRLIAVETAYTDPSDGSIDVGATVGELSYDGMGRRIKKDVQNSGDLTAQYHYYYDGQSIIEICNGSNQTLKHYVWGLDYIDELIEVAMNDDPSSDNTVDTHYWATHNANYNVTQLIDSGGDIKERYEYTPYGERVVYFSPGANDPDASARILMSQRVLDMSGVSYNYGLNEIGHQGLYHDEEWGLVYNRARMLIST